MLKEEERRREEQQEKEEIARMRQEQVSRLHSSTPNSWRSEETATRLSYLLLHLCSLQVHKAQPIRHYKAVAVKKSEVPLTLPQSPNFSNRFCL